MGAKDIAEKNLEAHNDVFADIVNMKLFDGEQVIHPDALEDAMPFSQYNDDKMFLISISDGYIIT